MRLTICLLWAAMVATLTSAAVAQEPFVHGLWVWKTASLLAAPNSGEALRDSAERKPLTRYIFPTRQTRPTQQKKSRSPGSSPCSIDRGFGWRRCSRA